MMRKNLPENITCATPHFKHFLPNNSITKPCRDKTEAFEFLDTFTNFVNDVVDNPESIGCPLPCRQVHYKTSLDYVHKNGWQIFDDEENSTVKRVDHFSLEYRYSTLFVEERIESYDYDVGSFLAAAGGNLGLFLGFSCLSVLFAAIKWIKIYLRKI
jgi:hypothetical protein